MLQHLHRMFEYTAYVLAPHIDARLDVVVTMLFAGLLVLLFAALVAMPRRRRIGHPSAPMPTHVARVLSRVAPLLGRRVRPTARPRAPTPAV